MKNKLTIEIEQEMLTATIEAMRELQMRYETEAWSLARLPSVQAQNLAQERLESAEVAAGLFSFFASL